MTNAARQQRARHAAAQTPCTDPVTQSWTVMMSLRESGTATVVVGERSMTTRQYRFTRLADYSLTGLEDVGLTDLLSTALYQASQDPELSAG